jgi:hypothetical protein
LFAVAFGKVDKPCGAEKEDKKRQNRQKITFHKIILWKNPLLHLQKNEKVI